MTGQTSIEWATAVWNPTTGCTRVSTGCDNCYAFALHDKRYKSNLDAANALYEKWDWRVDGQPHVDAVNGGPRRIAWVRFVSEGRALPYPRQYDLPFSRVQLLEERLEDPLRHGKPERYFVDSMADLFHEDVPDEFVDRVYATMGAAEWHTFLVLTKRPERARRYYEQWTRRLDDPRPLPNVWLGTSVEDQRAADERIPHLLATPAAVRFLSCEPLLGPVDLEGEWLHGRREAPQAAPSHRPGQPPVGEMRLVPSGDVVEGRDRPAVPDASARRHTLQGDVQSRALGTVDWVIVGGESGARARLMDLAWARSLVQQCRAAGVAVFVKQLGSAPFEEDGRTSEVAMTFDDDGSMTSETRHVGTLVRLRDRKGGDISEWPEDLRIREFPR